MAHDLCIHVIPLSEWVFSIELCFDFGMENGNSRLMYLNKRQDLNWTLTISMSCHLKVSNCIYQRLEI
jgi:hypothetical protein